jgi:hypothetical protein
VRFIGPIERDSRREWDEEVFKGDEGFDLAEAVAEFGPGSQLVKTFSSLAKM